MTQTYSPAYLEKLRIQAAAEIEDRKARGEWEGEVEPHTAYQMDPIGWIVKYLEVPEETIRWSISPEYADHKWDGAEDPLVIALECLANSRNVAIESATGVGKTALAAFITFWFLSSFRNSLVIQAAPKESQLLRGVWKEIGRFWPRFQKHFPRAELLTGKLRMSPAKGEEEVWAATAMTVGVGANEEAATKAQGSHAEHMLHITEETPGVHHAIMTAFEQTQTDDHNIQLSLGNPDHRKDTLHVYAMKPTVEHIRISAFDHPNIVTGRKIVPGAIGPRRLEERIEDLGRGSRLFQSRVRGISPAESDSALIKEEWCLMAAKKYEDEEYRKGALALGVDVADSDDGDPGSIAHWQGACCTLVESFPCPDGNELGTRVAGLMEDSFAPIDARHVGVDSVGVGSGCVNELKRLGHKVRRISSATRAIPGLDKDELWSITEDVDGRLKARGAAVVEAERFDNLRSQVLWRLREDLRLGRIALPYDEELFEDLTTPEWKTDGGIIRVEQKKDIKKRLKRSPDKGDACAYGNWVRRRSPIQPKQRDEFKRQPNVDYGLEKMIARNKKEVAFRERQARKELKRMGFG